MKNIVPYSLLLSLLWVSCNNGDKPFMISIESSRLADSIPSGSGIAVRDDSAYIIGDDAIGLYKVSIETLKGRKINFRHVDTTLYRIAKPVKHDYESAAIGTSHNKKYLLAFGSGTLSPYRDSLLFIDVDDETKQETISLAEFYKTICEKNSIKKENLNIEAATIAGNDLYLFNRGNNMVLAINWQDFLDRVSILPKKRALPDVKTYVIELPGISAIPARFSGATTLDEHTILFTASLEDTKNWIDDGDILGSYIGILHLSEAGPRLGQTFLLKKDTQPLKVKLESLDVLSASKDKIVVECVADNDDGSSTFYKVILSR
jgi:hypothetical protein